MSSNLSSFIRALCALWRTVTPQRGTRQAVVLPGSFSVQQSLIAGIPAHVLTRGIYAAYHDCQLLAVLPLEVHQQFARASARGHAVFSIAVTVHGCAV